MARIINPESAGKDRIRLTKATVLAIRELMRQASPDEQTRDLAAFIVLAMKEIAETIDPTVETWEKRGYWVKADRFRMDWDWCNSLGGKMRLATLAEDWASVAQLAVQVAMKLGNVKVAKNHRLGTPWTGAWNRLQSLN